MLVSGRLDAWLNNDVHVNAVGISGPGTGRFEIGGTLTYPSQTVSPFAVYSVANASDMIVPEPSTGLLVIAGLLGLADRRRART